MPLSPENLDRRKKILLAATAIALGTAALRKNKIIGNKIYSASLWEASQTIIADIITDGKELGGRLAAKLVRNSSNDVVDILPDENSEEIPESLMDEYERVFINTDWSKPDKNTLQTG